MLFTVSRVQIFRVKHCLLFAEGGAGWRDLRISKYKLSYIPFFSRSSPSEYGPGMRIGLYTHLPEAYTRSMQQIWGRGGGWPQAVLLASEYAGKYSN